MQGLIDMNEEKSVTFTARDIAEALRHLAWHKGILIPIDARLTLVKDKPYRAASATLTWKGAMLDQQWAWARNQSANTDMSAIGGGGGMRK
jgi:hypothetical protein